MAALSGIIAPMVTPFTQNDAIDERALRRETGALLAAGVAGLAIGTDSGEGYTLSTAELVQIVQTVRSEAPSAIPVIATVTGGATRAVIARAKALRDAGADLLLVPPIGSPFPPDAHAARALAERIARAVGDAILLVDPAPDTVAPLISSHALGGVVARQGGLSGLADLLRLTRGQVATLTTHDDLLYPAFMLGADGAIATICTVLPRTCAQLWAACQRGDREQALILHGRLLPVCRALEGPDPPARVKATLELLGRRPGSPRHPLTVLPPIARTAIEEALVEAGALGTEIV